MQNFEVIFIANLSKLMQIYGRILIIKRQDLKFTYSKTETRLT